MNIKQKHKIGDRPWMMWENKAVQCVVHGLVIRVYRKVVVVTYKIVVEGEHKEVDEKVLFKSKRLLLKSL